MREYRKRKRAAMMGAPASPVSSSSIVRALELSLVPAQGLGRAGPQPAPPNTGFVRKGAGSSFKTALELVQTFPCGILASQVCPYCYDTGQSSPGTRCSCRRGHR
jgi:hypothetical protein